jgi:hypothetical protein
LNLRLYFSIQSTEYGLCEATNSPFLELSMPIFTRLLLWPPGFLPRRSSAAAKIPPGPEPFRPAVSTSDAAPPTLPLGGAEPAATRPESVGERRAAALRGMFPMLFSMYARRSDLWHAIAIERYLSQATDIADLERRIRDVERRRQFSWSE